MKPGFALILPLLALAFAGPVGSSSADDTITTVITIEEAPAYANLGTTIRRLTSGLLYTHYIKSLDSRKIDLKLYTVLPSENEWRIYLPHGNTTENSGLIVWFSEDSDGEFPEALMQAARDRNFAIIAAMDADEDEDLIQLRAPLALIGLNHMIRNYSIDKSRIYAAGAETSAIDAERIALGFPDIFSGVLAIGGGMAIGTKEVPVPVTPLPAMAAKKLDIVFVHMDATEIGTATESVEAFHSYCLIGAHKIVNDGAQSPAQLYSAAIRQMDESGEFDVNTSCMTALQKRVEAIKAKIDELTKKNDWAEIRKELIDLNIRYGGYAEDQINRYASKIRERDADLMNDAAEFMAPFEFDTRIEGINPVASPGM